MRAGTRAAAAASVFAALTLLFTFPLSLAPGSRALPLSADTRLFLWTLAWDVHALVHQPLHLFDANIFFPERHTLAYSEHLLGSALLGAPWLLGGGNALLALNAVVLLSCVLCALGAFVLARQLGVGTAGALAAGLVFAFAPPRFFRLAQVHLAAVQWIPFCLACAHGYVRTGDRRRLWAACAFFTLQALASGHGGLFLALALALLAAYLWSNGRLPPLGRLVRDLGVPGALILALNVPFLVPYLQARREVGLHRTLGAVEDWAPNAVSFLAAPTHVQQALVRLVPGLTERVEAARAYLFPGWLTLAFAALALRRRRDTRGAEPAGVAAPSQGPAIANAPSRAPTIASEPSPAPATARTPQPRPSFAVAALDALIAAAAVAVVVIHTRGGIAWDLAGITISARGPGRAAAVLAGLLAVRLVAARRAPIALAGPARNAVAALHGWTAARTGAELGFYALLALVSLWAALGPSFGLYSALYAFVPGFDLIRVPSRLTILALLGAAVLAGAGLERALARVPPSRRPVLGAIALAAFAAEFAAFPLKAPPYAIEIPAIDHWLAGQPAPFVAVELPIADPADAVRSARLHSQYMLHSTVHWQPIVNGYSGLVPPRHERLYRLLAGFPEESGPREAGLRELQALGVRYAVLHREAYTPAAWERAVRGIESLGARVTLEHAEPDGRVYRLARSEGER